MNSENLVYKISPGAINSNAIALDLLPASKSQCNRALILAVLKGGMRVSPLAQSSDTLHILNAFKTLGIKTEIKKNEFHAKESFYQAEKRLVGEKITKIYAFDGGTTTRFLMALLASGEKSYFLVLEKEMLQRPMDELVEALNFLGAKIVKHEDGDDSGYLIQGPLFKLANDSLVSVEIESARSSQFYTSLKLLTIKFPKLDVVAKNLENSAAYALMTDEALKRANVSDHLKIAYDFSSLGYLIAFMALSTGGELQNITELDPEQADSALFSILKESGAKLELSGQGLKVQGSRDLLRPFSADAAKYPDLIPTLVFLAAHIEGESEFLNLQILTYKESNRTKELLFLLELFEVTHQFDSKEHRLVIQGSCSKTYRAIDYFPPNDHRMIMTAALFMRLNYGGLIYKAEHVRKSFPNFFEFLAD